MSTVSRPLQTVLVTGGCGFIGTNFIRYLFEHPQFTGTIINLDALTYAGNPHNLRDVEELHGPARSDRYRFYHTDIRDLGAVEAIFNENAIDTVVHFAAESHVDRSISGPRTFVETNVVGTLNLLEAARRSWLHPPGTQRANTMRGRTTEPGDSTHSDSLVKRSAALRIQKARVRAPYVPGGNAATTPRTDVLFHHVSTDEVFGSLGLTGSFSENSPYAPRSPYSASKAASDHLVRAYAHTYGLPVTISNCSNNYGPYQFPEKMLPLMILNAAEGQELPVYGAGTNVRDWLYVEDHAAAIELILRRGRAGETYLIGGRNEWQNIRLVEAVCDKLATLNGRTADEYRRLIRHVADRPGHDYRYAISSDKIEHELGWRPRHDFSTGLDDTIAWYLANPDWVQLVRSGAYRDWMEANYAHR